MRAAKPTAFISYARSDGRAVAADLRQRLQDEGVSVWQDLAHMEGGPDWWQQIETAIKSVEYLLLVMTPGALRNESVVRREWRFARQEGICVIPIVGDSRITSSEAFEALPGWMKRAHWMDAEIPEQWTRLLSMLHSPCDTRRVPFMADDLPEDFVSRRTENHAVIDKLVDPARGEPVATTGVLHGTGGFGKTLLAKAICHESAIQDAFDDGILWISLGAQPGDLRGRIADLIETLTVERPAFEQLGAATTRLREAIGDRRMLLVIDDVWNPAHCQPFLEGGGNCARLITTRDISNVPATASFLPVDAMTPDEALQLLRFGLPEEEDDALRALARRLGEWPLLLKLANGALRERVTMANQPFTRAVAYVNTALERKGLVAFDRSNGTARNQAVKATLGMSLDLLTGDEQQRLAELAVFAEDVDIPLAAVEALWEATGALDEFATEELCVKLHRLSLLLNLDLGARRLRLHDIIRSYHLPRDPSARQNPHTKLIAAYRVKCSDRWATGPDDGYFFQWLPYHLAEADLADELRSILLDYRWMAAKLQATSIQALIADYDRLPEDDEELRLVRHALVLSANVLAKAENQHQFASQLIGRLTGLGSDGVARVIQEAGQENRFPWLRPRTRSLIPAGGPLLRRLPVFNQDIATLKISADACRVRVEFDDRSEQFWDMERGTRRADAEDIGVFFGPLARWDGEPPPLDATPGHTSGSSVTSLAMTSDGELAISGGEDWDLKVWDLQSNTVVATLPFHRDAITSVAVTPEGRRAVSAARDGTVMLWDLRRAREAPPEQRKLPIASIAATAAGSGSAVVAFGTQELRPWDNAIHVWDLTSGREVASLEGHEKPVSSVAVTADGRYAVSGSQDETLRFWDTASRREVASLRGHNGSVTAVAITPDGHVAVSGSEDNTVRIWDLEGRRERENLEIEGIVNSVSVTPDGHHVVAATEKEIVCHWDLSYSPRRAPQTLRGGGEVLAVAVTPDGHHAVFGLADGSLRLWDLTTGDDVFCLSTEMTPVSSVAITPDGQRAASGSDDMMVRLWDLPDRREIARFTADNPVWAVACCGTAQIIAGDSGGQLHILELIEERGDA